MIFFFIKRKKLCGAETPTKLLIGPQKLIIWFDVKIKILFYKILCIAH